MAKIHPEAISLPKPEEEVDTGKPEDVEKSEAEAAPKILTFGETRFSRWPIPILIATLCYASLVYFNGILARGDIPVTHETAFIRGLVLLYFPAFGILPWIITMQATGLKMADDPTFNQIELKPAVISSAIIGVLQFLIMWTTVGWGVAGMICQNFAILAAVVHAKFSKGYDKKVPKMLQDVINALYVPAYGGLGVTISYPYVAKALPDIAGVLLTLLLSCLEGIGNKLLARAAGKHCENQKPFVVQSVVIAGVAIMDSFRFSAPLAAVMKNPNEMSWISSFASGLVLSTLVRTGWFTFWMSNMFFRLTGKNMFLPGPLVFIQRDAKFVTGYVRLTLPLSLMLGRLLFGSTEPWYINETTLIMMAVCFGQMLVEDAICLFARCYGLEAKPNARMMAFYESQPAEKPYKRAYRYSSTGEIEPAVNYEPMPFWIDFCVILVTGGSVFQVVLGAVIPNLSNMCFLGLSSTCEASATDGYFYWPIQS